jgi:hypothetical protein
MSDGIVTVNAEWALRGKESIDAGYRLLNYSHGIISRANFEDVLSRYAAGTPDELPQVTFSWLRSSQSYLAVAIHGSDERFRRDVVGRKVVRTNCFCLPFAELAKAAISYSEMYDQLHVVRLPTDVRNPIDVNLAGRDPKVPEELAIRAAALLITGKPVCILGADKVTIMERLRFLDMVASLLPYGMRSRLSTSTWASSTFKDHNIRLFFASESRQQDDHDVIWNEGHDPLPIGDDWADNYLIWLRRRINARPSQLVSITDELGFGAADIPKVLQRVETISGSTTVQLARQALIQQTLVRTSSIDELLATSASRLRSKNPNFLDINGLRSHLSSQRSDDERRRYQWLIKENGLLRDRLPITRQIRSQFFDVLLKIAFDVPLSYASYCQIEEIVGHLPGQSLHTALLEAIRDVGIASPRARLIVLQAIGEKELKRGLQENPMGIIDLIDIAANPNISPSHGKIFCKILMNILAEQSGHLDREMLRSALSWYGYLAPVLERRHPDDLNYQHELLSHLLVVTHGQVLDRSTVQKVFDSNFSTASPALFGALLDLVRPGEIKFVQSMFTSSAVARAGYAEQTLQRLTALLSGYGWPAGWRDVQPPRKTFARRRRNRRIVGGIRSWLRSLRDSAGLGKKILLTAIVVAAIVFVLFMAYEISQVIIVIGRRIN